MSREYRDDAYRRSIPENYERYFVPTIGEPLAHDLIEIARLDHGERVLDVACGTGIVARLASQKVGAAGTAAGLDVNPGMLAVARATSPPGMAVDWREASAEGMPFSDASFDAVLCQMGIQFIPDKLSALKEMRRVLTPGGRLVLNVPGPIPPLFKIFQEALARDISATAASFVSQVFLLHDEQEIRQLLNEAAFKDIAIQAVIKELPLPEPEKFLWQYVYSTPLAGALAGASDEALSSLAHRIATDWQQFVQDRALWLQVRMVTATARR